MWPFTVAGLALRYFRINFSIIIGHPFKNPLRAAFRRVESWGYTGIGVQICWR
jgi:hypothetical protein